MKIPILNFRRVLLIFIMVLSVLPFAENRFNIISVSKLGGYFAFPADTCFSWKGWFSAAYQRKKEKFLNDSFGFRNIFVRFNNQISFDLFDKNSDKEVIVGKKNYLYESTYIDSYYGKNFAGEDSIKHILQRFRFLQDTLGKLDKTVFMVIAPGKGWYFPEYIPDVYKTAKGPTNYECTVKLAKELGINCIDFNKYFLDNKPSSPYPLFSQLGIHWSFYGESLAADSMIKYIEHMRHIRIPHVYWNHIDLATEKGWDMDLENGMNLLFQLNSYKCGYPELKFESDSGKTKPNLLTIGDSFFYGIDNIGVAKKCFNTCSFWYYNKQIDLYTPDKGLTPDKVDIKQAIKKNDVILLINTEATISDLGSGFIERVCEAYKPHL